MAAAAVCPVRFQGIIYSVYYRDEATELTIHHRSSARPRPCCHRVTQRCLLTLKHAAQYVSHNHDHNPLTLQSNVKSTDINYQVTNAKVAHHDSSIIHNHPSSPSIPKDSTKAMDAEQCPAVKSMAKADPVENEICPVTNAKLEHHEGKVHLHPKVADDAAAAKCPVVGGKTAA